MPVILKPKGILSTREHLSVLENIEVTAAAAESFQSCPTLCDPIDGSPAGSATPGILQARTLEWAARQQRESYRLMLSRRNRQKGRRWDRFHVKSINTHAEQTGLCHQGLGWGSLGESAWKEDRGELLGPGDALFLNLGTPVTCMFSLWKSVKLPKMGTQYYTQSSVRCMAGTGENLCIRLQGHR